MSYTATSAIPESRYNAASCNESTGNFTHTLHDPVPRAALPGSLGLYAVTIFLSAFLLFQVQPMIAKLILPWFGGSAAVWVTCMLFFQIALLLGYGYAHLMVRTVPLAPPGDGAHRAPAAQPGHAPDSSQSAMEAGRRRRSALRHHGSARAHRRIALHAALVHQSAAAILVLTVPRRRDCPIVSSPSPTWARCWRCSAIRSWSNPISATGRRRGSGRAHSWRSPAAASPWRCPAAKDTRQRRPRRRKIAAPGWSVRILWMLLAAAASAHAAGRHQPHDPERGGHPVPLDRAAQHLPADVHPVLREPPLVFARGLRARSSPWVWDLLAWFITTQETPDTPLIAILIPKLAKYFKEPACSTPSSSSRWCCSWCAWSVTANCRA